MKKKKKIKDLTLQEIIDICTYSYCENCKLCFGRSQSTTSRVCVFKGDVEPYQWDAFNGYAEEIDFEVEVDE